MVLPPQTVIFDPTKPTDGTSPSVISRLKSKDVRDNFIALSRANDLRPSANLPPNTAVLVQSGRFLITSSSAIDFAGGSIDLAANFIGGSSINTNNIVVVLIDSTATLSVLQSGWGPSPIPPPYPGNKIAICEVNLLFTDTVVTDGMIRDVRPFINLSAGSTIVSPMEIQIEAVDTGGGGQSDFDVSPAFLYTPGSHEILVWVADTSDPYGSRHGEFQRSSGAFFDATKDYQELNSSTIRFNTQVPAGQVVTVWRVGLAASSYAMRNLSDLVAADLADTGDRATAFLTRSPGDVPSGLNPYLTEVSHSFVDHSLISPINTILLNVTTALAHVNNVGGTSPIPAGSQPPFHDAADIRVNPAVLTYSASTNIQGVLNDIELSIYDTFLAEHILTGQHGPKVTITQSNADNALVIAKTSTGVGDVVLVGNSGSGKILVVTNGSAGDNVIDIINSAAHRSISIQQNGDDAGIFITQAGVGSGLGINKTSTSNSAAISVVVASGTGAGLLISKSATGAGNPLLINNSGSGSGAVINQSGANNALVLSQAANVAGLAITKSGVGVGDAILVANSGSGAGIAIFQNNLGASTGAVYISNSGTGPDVFGTGGNWSVTKNGLGTFFGGLTTGGKVIIGQGPVINVTHTIPGNLGEITPTASYHRVDVGAVDCVLSRINGGTTGQLLVIEVFGHAMCIRPFYNILANENVAVGELRFYMMSSTGIWTPFSR